MPEDKRLPLGLHALKIIVCGDHSYVDVYVAIVPPHTDCIVFSIDGSFSASISVSGKNPKVRPGAVDVVRYWQDMGYLILYVTARPDIQQRLVVSWLSQHNFPHGLLFFTEGISAEPLRQKTNYLKSLLSEHQICIRAAYGSGKDVHVYKEVGLKKETVFAIGKVSKKWQDDCQVLIFHSGVSL
ncbi:unnamed protein product [Soboliphyme baturini]|uniref:LNS2 domain-containing protein n=1 Tax=Soboliphyme baturini TaxID=241478 RepID=A0A183IA42_9BILA|nr:unnamed protein product [Soboliphyme baturini]